jgi:GT2 family glycosyltransferase
MLFLKGDTLGITRYSPQIVKTVDWVSGACLGGSKDAFLEVGLFDDAIFMYMEDIDFLYRAKKTGYTALFYPDARFIHLGAASSANRKTPVLNIYKGLLYFYRIHMSIIDQRILRLLLKSKAVIAILVGKLIGRGDLVSIYEDAITLV